MRLREWLAAPKVAGKRGSGSTINKAMLLQVFCEEVAESLQQGKARSRSLLRERSGSACVRAAGEEELQLVIVRYT